MSSKPATEKIEGNILFQDMTISRGGSAYIRFKYHDHEDFFCCYAHAEYVHHFLFVIHKNTV